MSDLDQPDLAAKAAQAAVAPDFDLLVGKARRRRRTAVLAGGLAVVLVGLGGAVAGAGLRNDAGPVVPGPTTMTPIVTTPGTTPSPSTPRTSPGTPPQTIPPDGPCPVTRLTGLPPGSGCASVVHGDFDGDGVRDTLISYAHPMDAADYPLGWHLRLAPGQGAPQNLDLHGIDTNLRVLAAVDVNRDGRDDALIDVHDGASTNSLGIVNDAAGRLRLIKAPDGTPDVVDFGATVDVGAGGGCRMVGGRPEIVESGYSRRNGAWHWVRYSFRLVGGHLVGLSHHGGLTTEQGASAYAQFHCFGIDWPDTVPPVRAR